MESKFFQKCLILSAFVLLQLIYCTKYSSSDDAGSKMLQKGRTRRLIWLDRQRIFNFPPDTSISVTPMLAFPLFKQSSNWVTFENLQIQWTFFILFEGLGWTSVKNAWPIDISLFLPNVTAGNDGDGEEDIRRRNTTVHDPSCNKNKLGSKCKIVSKADIPVMALPIKTPGGERATLIPRLEAILNSFGIDGRACLQRAVCEIHEIPLKHGFGLIGEFLTMIFNISESDYAQSHLQGYLKAEEAGKIGDCSHFNRKCSHSLFTSKQNR